MGKFNRLVCLLIMPIIAMFCFSGCEKDKTKEDVVNKLSAIKDTYKIELENGEYTNELFDNNGLMQISYVNKEMKSIYDSGKFNESKFETDFNLYKRYYMLLNLQHKVLNNAMIYYNQMSENFYEKSDILKVKTQDFNEVHKRLEDLEDAIKTFKVAKDKLEQTVEVLTFNGVVRADLTSYSYSVNLLIEEIIEFNEFFKCLNEKYLFKEDVLESNKVSFAKHYVAEFAHKINEVVYYRYLKAFNNVNECDLTALYESNIYKEDTIINSFYSNNWTMVEAVQRSFDYLDPTIEISQIEEFQEVRNGFLQKFDIYKLVYNIMDYYRYNQTLMGNLSVGESLDETGQAMELANIKLIENFYNTSVVDYFKDSFWDQVL